MYEDLDLYLVLGATREDDVAAIKSKYRKLALKYHPDTNPGDSEAEEKFKEAAFAYEILGDPEKRAKYDAHGFRDLEDTFSDMVDVFKKIVDMMKEWYGGDNWDKPSPNPERDAIISHFMATGGQLKADEQPVYDLSGFSFSQSLDFTGAYWDRVRIHGKPDDKKTVNDLILTSATLDYLDLQDVILKNCALSGQGRGFAFNVNIENCVFEACDLSHRSFNGKRFENVVFKDDTKLNGMMFCDCELKNVTIDTANFDEISFLFSKIDGLKLSEAAAAKVSFLTSAEWKNVSVMCSDGREVDIQQYRKEQREAKRAASAVDEQPPEADFVPPSPKAEQKESGGKLLHVGGGAAVSLLGGVAFKAITDGIKEKEAAGEQVSWVSRVCQVGAGMAAIGGMGYAAYRGLNGGKGGR